MSQKYNLNDPTDLDIMRAVYDRISQEEWQAYVDFSFLPEYKLTFKYDDRECLIRMAKQAGQHRKPADKDIRWGLSLADKIDSLRELNAVDKNIEKALENHEQHLKTKHFTFRVAWHDNKWNGTVCNDPLKNRYCSGFNSLLSERLRKRKEINIKNELKYKSQPVNKDYIPPCFWSINIFGHKDLTVKHDNPAEPALNHIPECLPSNSMFSWPFAVSFTRTKEQINTDGAYPKNLESVRIPQFSSKIKEKHSVAFMYAKYSNPLTEEEQQYLVVGCGLVTEKGLPTFFNQHDIIEKKRNSKPKNRNFPSMNWALRYSFHEPDLLVRMPYHEYLDYVNRPEFDEESKQSYLSKIKVAITEPELTHCFKYVAMDIDDDEAIYILSKIRKQLIECKDDGIVSPAEMQNKIDSVEQLLSFCWKQRTYFPGFPAICREILNWDKPEFLLDDLLEELQQAELDDYAEKFISLIKNPSSDAAYKRYKSLLLDVKEKLEQNYGLSTDQFIQLCFLNLKTFQYNRILSGKLKLSGDWRKKIEDERRSHSTDDICNNPYLLFEDYKPYESMLHPVTGEEMDGPIDLFKIDIAYFPDMRFGIERIDLQRQMTNIDKRRLRALCIRYLRTLENTGHCFADAKEMEEAIKSYPLFFNIGSEYHIPSHFFLTLNTDYILHFEENDSKVKVLSENDTKYFYLFEVYNAEGEIEKIIHQLVKEEQISDNFNNLDNYLNNSCKILRDKIGSEFDEIQFRHERTQLYEDIYKHRVFVLAGNPGSGKSYELLNIISDWQDKNESCLLLAPTGKAALRLKTDKKFKNIDAFTIDKIMADINNGKLSKASLTAYNNIIIDEMSMVDLLKLKNLLNLVNINLPSFNRLVLVGDPHQLPAIGYGKVLKDILYYFKTHPEHSNKYIELQTNCRHELAESKILEFSEGFITDGEISNELKTLICSGNPDISKGFRIHFWDSEKDLYKLINTEFDYLCENLSLTGNSTAKLNKIFKLKADGSLPVNKDFQLEFFQILSPYKSDFYGASQVNDYIQREYKPDLDLSLVNDWFKQSDKIIRTRNYYEKGILILSNGSIGLVRKDAEPTLYFPELVSPMPVSGENGLRSKSESEYFDLAYAITVHKAQGSGFDHCFFILPKKTGLLSKELIYTALTRSRSSITLFVQGEAKQKFEKSALEKARLRSYTESRKTTLLLDRPFRYYALEADGNFIESRVELLIYQTLKEAQKKYGEDNLLFEYEVPPVIEGKTLPMKTDFTLLTSNGIWYWEHLGRLGNKNYEWTWHNVKIKSYEEYGAKERLITTHEINGINPEKIKEIIDLIMENKITSEDPTNKYSLHHYSLR